MRNKPVIRVADDVTVIRDYWRYGLRRGAVIKLAQLIAYTAKLLVSHRWDRFLWEYLGCLWSVERRCGNDPR